MSQQGRVQTGVLAGGQFDRAEKSRTGIRLDSVPQEPNRPYLNHQPAQVDTELIAALLEQAEAARRLAGINQAVERQVEHARAFGLSRDVTTSAVAKLEAQRPQWDLAVARSAARVRTCDDEFEARGGWNRGWYVTGGHVHRSQQCSTLRPTTRISLIADLSGLDESEIVEHTDETACTCCYPDAPVDILSRPPRVGLPGWDEAQRATAERAERAAAKRSKDAATGITNPDGTPLRGDWGVVKTERSAQTELVTLISDNRLYGYRAKLEVQAGIFEALAGKRGQSIEDVQADIELKVAARIKRERR